MLLCIPIQKMARTLGAICRLVGRTSSPSGSFDAFWRTRRWRRRKLEATQKWQQHQWIESTILFFPFKRLGKIGSLKQLANFEKEPCKNGQPTKERDTIRVTTFLPQKPKIRECCKPLETGNSLQNEAVCYTREKRSPPPGQLFYLFFKAFPFLERPQNRNFLVVLDLNIERFFPANAVTWLGQIKILKLSRKDTFFIFWSVITTYISMPWHWNWQQITFLIFVSL